MSREGDGLHLRRSDGTEYTAQDDAVVRAEGAKQAFANAQA